jgi:Recombinase zinc beta ribbon domain
VQGVLDGRYEVTSPKQRNDPDFPLRGYAHCETCGKPLTASWSKGRSNYYAYYHCRGRCRAVNISKAKLEELFVEELARLQPTAGFMRLVKDRVMRAWRELKTDATQRIAEVERRQKAIHEKLDRLDQAFLFERTIEIDTYDRHRDKLREELTLVQMDRPLLGARGNGRRRHPGVRGTRSTERVEPLGPVLARSEAAPAAGVLSGWSSLRREKACWNRLNPAGFQLREPDFG